MAADPRLGAGTGALIADVENTVLVSAVSMWEIVLKIRVGKLKADLGETVRAIDRQGLGWLAIERRHLDGLRRLPVFPDHRDPFDHLLIAQAAVEKAIFVSNDRNVDRYAVPYRTCSS